MLRIVIQRVPVLKFVSITPNDVLQRDVLFISKGRMEIITGNNIQGAPDLVTFLIFYSSLSLRVGDSSLAIAEAI